MSRNALVIGANNEAIFSIQLAHRHGLTVYALDGNPKAAGLGAADQAFTVDINDLDTVFSIADPLKPMVVVPAPIGHCLTTIGAVNDRYCLAGVSEQAAKICTDKYLFHETLFNEGLRDAVALLIPKGSVINRAESNEFFRKVGNPESAAMIILKPRDGSGSRGVVTCQDEESFWKEINQLNSIDGGFPEDYIAETCVPGEEYGIDGGYVGGEFHMTLLRHKKNTPLPFRQCVGYSSVLPEEAPAFYKNCVRLMQDAGESIGLMNCVVHADIIRKVRDGQISDEPFPIEISARPSGHNLSNLFTPLATGVTIVDDFLNLALPDLHDRLPRDEYMKFCRNLYRPAYTKKLLIRYFDLKSGTVEELPKKEILKKLTEEGVLVSYHCAIKERDQLETVTNGASLMGRGYFILQGKSDDELEATAQEILGQFVIT